MLAASARRLSVVIALAAPTLAQQSVAIDTSFTGPASTVELISGLGAALGQPDPTITVLPGPSSTWFAGPFTPADFAAADNGASAMVLDTSYSGWVDASELHPAAAWIGPNLASGTGGSSVSGLFSIPFEMPEPFPGMVTLELRYALDDFLGGGATAGVYVNGRAVPNTASKGTYSKTNVMFRNISMFVRPGENRLYLNMTNTGGNGGLAFYARIHLSQGIADECGDARPAYEGALVGINLGATTSRSPASSCGLTTDVWYAYVPEASGTLDVTVDKADAGVGYAPGVAAFDGSCGALSLLACDVAAGTGFFASASLTVPAQAGTPVLLAVGGGQGTYGRFELDLRLTPSSSSYVYAGNGHKYVLSDTEMTWKNAQTWAAGQGGYLASINDKPENDWIAATLPLSGSTWIGVTDEAVEGTWVFDSGEPYGAFSNWAPGEPNDFAACGGEDYAEMSTNGSWNDISDDACGSGGRRALAEIPGGSFGSAAVLPGGACGQSPFARLVSEPHVVGTNAQMALLDAPPFTPAIVWRSPITPAPVVAEGCSVWVDLLQATPAMVVVTNAYGSSPFTITVPNNPLLVGVQEHWQGQVTSGPGAPLSYSNGLVVTIGN